MDLTIIDYFGRQVSRCGYCKGSQCSIGHGMHAYQMGVQDYQDLIDRGWRRSGHYCYKQDNKTTCCPCYTIRCDALEFQLNKSNKKILKRMNRFLRDGKRDKNEEKTNESIIQDDNNDADNGDAVANDRIGVLEEVIPPNVTLKDINFEAIQKSNDTHQKALTLQQPLQKPKQNNVTEGSCRLQQSKNTMDISNSADADTVMLPPRKKAKQIRLERRLAKQMSKGLNTNELPTKTNKQPPTKTLKDFIYDTHPETDKHQLKVILMPAKKSNFTDDAYNLYCKYQTIVHKDKPERLKPSNLQRFLYNSPLKLVLVHVCSKQFTESLPITYALYQKYQTIIHNQPPRGHMEYLEFLQQSPLKHVKPSDGPPSGYGSFHQQYWLDDKLIAVAVLDILPYCVSSVYFFYDPDYSFLSLGTYSSLREIEFVQQLASVVPNLRYYYMGFYIHSCPKMRYKGKLSASYLLCSEAYTWHLLTDEIRCNLNECKYQRFNEDATATDENEFNTNDINSIVLLIDENVCITYQEHVRFCKIDTLARLWDILRNRIYKEITGSDDRSMIIEYGRLVGKKLAHRLLYLKM